MDASSHVSTPSHMNKTSTHRKGRRSSIPPEQRAEIRRLKKQNMERRRRACISDKLNALHNLVISITGADPHEHQKTEKADILSMCYEVFEGIAQIAEDEPELQSRLHQLRSSLQHSPGDKQSEYSLGKTLQKGQNRKSSGFDSRSSEIEIEDKENRIPKSSTSQSQSNIHSHHQPELKRQYKVHLQQSTPLHQIQWPKGYQRQTGAFVDSGFDSPRNDSGDGTAQHTLVTQSLRSASIDRNQEPVNPTHLRQSQINHSNFFGYKSQKNLTNWCEFFSSPEELLPGHTDTIQPPVWRPYLD